MTVNYGADNDTVSEKSKKSFTKTSIRHKESSDDDDDRYVIDGPTSATFSRNHKNKSSGVMHHPVTEQKSKDYYNKGLIPRKSEQVNGGAANYTNTK